MQILYVIIVGNTTAHTTVIGIGSWNACEIVIIVAVSGMLSTSCEDQRVSNVIVGENVLILQKCVIALM